MAFILDASALGFMDDHRQVIKVKDSKGRWRPTTTRPTKDSRQRLYADLEGAWIEVQELTDAPRKSVPTVIYSDGQYRGRYVRFVQTFAGAVADHIDQRPTAPYGTE